MVMRKKVFICSPFRGDMEGNARKVAVYSRMVCEQGYLPIAPHMLFPQFLNEGIEAERQLGMQTTAVYSCVRILSEAIASLPVHVYRYTES